MVMDGYELAGFLTKRLNRSRVCKSPEIFESPTLDTDFESIAVSEHIENVNALTILDLPLDILKCIIDWLPTPSVVALSLVTKGMYAAMHPRKLRYYDPAKLDFLKLLERESPDHIACHTCVKLHSITKFENTSINPCVRCLKASPRKYWDIKYQNPEFYEARFQMMMKRYRQGRDVNYDVGGMIYTCEKPGLENYRSTETTFKIINGSLFLRTHQVVLIRIKEAEERSERERRPANGLKNQFESEFVDIVTKASFKDTDLAKLLNLPCQHISRATVAPWFDVMSFRLCIKRRADIGSVFQGIGRSIYHSPACSASECLHSVPSRKPSKSEELAHIYKCDTCQAELRSGIFNVGKGVFGIYLTTWKHLGEGKSPNDKSYLVHLQSAEDIARRYALSTFLDSFRPESIYPVFEGENALCPWNYTEVILPGANSWLEGKLARRLSDDGREEKEKREPAKFRDLGYLSIY